MADYSSVAPPSSNNGAGMNDAFKDALQRARQVRRTINSPWCKNNVEVARVWASYGAFSAVRFDNEAAYAKLTAIS